MDSTTWNEWDTNTLNYGEIHERFAVGEKPCTANIEFSFDFGDVI